MVSHFPNCGGLKIGSNMKQCFYQMQPIRFSQNFHAQFLNGWKGCLNNFTSNVEKSFKDQFQLDSNFKIFHCKQKVNKIPQIDQKC